MYLIVWNYLSEGWLFHDLSFKTAEGALLTAIEENRAPFKIVKEVLFKEKLIEEE